MPETPKTDSHMEYSANQSRNYDTIRGASPAIVLQISSFFGLGRPDSPHYILDVGCGSGNYLVEFGKRTHLDLRLVGFDTSETMLRQAEPKVRGLKVQLEHMDMRHIRFDDNSFDAVYFVHALHHCGGNVEYTLAEREAYRREAIGETCRVLHPQGKVILVQSDPWQNEANPLWAVYFPWALEKKKIIQPSSDDIAAWLVDAGFESVGSHTFHDYLTRPVFSPEIALVDSLLPTYSEFSYITAEQLEEGRRHLRSDMKDGELEKVIAASKKKYDDGGGNFTAVLGKKQSV